MRVAVIGTGYVGLVTGTCLAEIGNDVTCVDVLPERVKAVNEAQPTFFEPGLAELLASNIRKQQLRASSDVVSAVECSDVTFLAVGTPCRGNEIDLSFLAKATEQVGQGLRKCSGYHLVVVKSTVVPSTTDTLVRDILERTSGKAAGEFGLCMNPEFLREGSAVSDFMDPDRIVIGRWDERSGRRLIELYNSFECPKILTSLRNAELTKYASNALLATLISFSNEFGRICEATPGTDVEEVLSALHFDRRLSPRYNGQPVKTGVLAYLRAGCGFGGSCLPKDVAALRYFSEKQGITTPLLDSVASVNVARTREVLELTESALGSVSGATIAVLGLAFKPGTDDLRDSPALAICDLLVHRGATVRAFDPMVAVVPDPAIRVCASAEEALTSADAAIVATAWPEFAGLQWDVMCRRMRQAIIVDGRNTLRDVSLPSEAVYVPIGRHFELKGMAVGK
jgi:UDPglucose 6-dehydrogenase/GDP-mannose 6-dehydrogenase